MTTYLILETLQVINGLAWLTLWVTLTGSVVRLTIRRVRQPFDPLWAILWFLSGHQLGYIARWLTDIVSDPTTPSDINTLIGLRVMSIMLAATLIHRRMLIEGLRW